MPEQVLACACHARRHGQQQLRTDKQFRRLHEGGLDHIDAPVQAAGGQLLVDGVVLPHAQVRKIEKGIQRQRAGGQPRVPEPRHGHERVLVERDPLEPRRGGRTEVAHGQVEASAIDRLEGLGVAADRCDVQHCLARLGRQRPAEAWQSAGRLLGVMPIERLRESGGAGLPA